MKCRRGDGTPDGVDTNLLTKGGIMGKSTLPLLEIGQRFGKWTVISERTSLYRNNKKRLFYLCTCECGSCPEGRYVQAALLIRGTSHDCGCERLAKHIKH